MNVKQKSETTSKASQWFSSIMSYLAIPVTLLLCGGDLGWWQAWLFFVLIVTAGIGGRIWAEQRHPGIMAERHNSSKAQGVKSWDKVLAPLMALSLSFGLVIVAGLDHRFACSPLFAVWMHLLGFALIASGYALATWALIENRFFSTFVRIQKERGHQVCSSGPYRMVRHPGYAGNLLALPGIVLALGSVWTLIPVAIAIIIALIRTELEDRTLQEELTGYKAYTEEVRYKLIPGIY